MTLRLGPPQLSALRDTIGAYMASEGGRRILEDLYALFASWEDGDPE